MVDFNRTISKNINRYYYLKAIACFGVIISATVVMIGSCADTFLGYNFMFKMSAFVYILMYVFVGILIFLPVGKFDLKKFVNNKKNIVDILRYIEEYNGGKNKFFDAINVIFRTTREVIHDKEIVDWETKEKYAAMLNAAWDQLFNFLKIKRGELSSTEEVKEFAKKLLNEIDKGSIVESIENEDTEGSVEYHVKKRSKISLSVVTMIFLEMCILAIVICKIKNARDSDVNLIYQIGSDVIAFFLTIFSISSEYRSINMDNLQ